MNKLLRIAAALALAAAAFAPAAQARSPFSKAPQFSAKDCDMLSVGSARAACMRSAAGSEPGADTAAAARATGSGNYWHTPSRSSGVLPPDVSSAPNSGADAGAIGGTAGAGAQSQTTGSVPAVSH